MQTGTGQILDGSSSCLSTASMPADRAQGNQGVQRVPRPITAFLRATRARKLGKALSRMVCRQNSQRSNFSFKKTSNHKSSFGSVTKDHSGWGFTVKQGSTTIREDGAAYTVSTSSLTMQVEAVTLPFAGLPQKVTVGPHMPLSSQI